MSNSTDTAKFISFEGTEGVGKTTAINNLCQTLDSKGIKYIRTREPGGSNFGEKMREVLLDPLTDINDETELLLMFAARSDHLSTVILPALESGKWVICDRFVDSSFAYQGFGRGFSEPPILDQIKALTTHFVPRMPDLTIWLDLDVSEGMKRAGKRSTADRFEQQTIDFFERVHQGYQNRLLNFPDRFKRIDANGNIDEVAKRIISTIYDSKIINFDTLGS